VENERWVPNPIARSSCYGKLHQVGGHVLLVGVAHNRNTFLHTAEEILGIPNRMGGDPAAVAIRRKDGTIIRRQMELFFTDYTDNISYRFPKYETAFRYHRCITDGFLGNAPTQLCDAVKMKETIELIYKNCGDNDPLWSEEPIPQKWYAEGK
jgi:aminoglycoside 3-N-acetyltransferase